MAKFTKPQLNRTSEIAGNIAVAWFSAGAISPFLSRSSSISEVLLNVIISLVMAGFFFGISLKLAKNTR